MGQLSAPEREYIADGIAQDLRLDGRGREDFRPFVVQTGVVSQATGSARLRLGATDVIACVKAEVGTPAASRPDQGRIEIAVECSPIAAPEYEGRGGDERAAELAGALERCFLGGASGAGAAVDLRALCIVPGKLCWLLLLDALLLGDGGNVLDAISMAFRAALSVTRLPKVVPVPGDAETGGGDDFELDDDPSEAAALDVAGVPIVVTLTKVGRHYIVDASSDEELPAAPAMSVAINGRGSLSGASKRGAEGLPPAVVADMLAAARRLGRRVFASVDAEVVRAEERAAAGEGASGGGDDDGDGEENDGSGSGKESGDGDAGDDSDEGFNA